MKLILLCVGTLKAGPEKDLISRYRSRLSWPFEMREVICRKKGTPAQIVEWEGELLVQALETGTAAIGLDSQGMSLTSEEFSQCIENYSLKGIRSLTFIIGGAGGLSSLVRSKCQKMISFGCMTWPHLLVRGLLVEQLYRAQQILSGHPYHRG